MGFASQAGNFGLLTGYAIQLLHHRFGRKRKIAGSGTVQNEAPPVLATRLAFGAISTLTTAGAIALALGWRCTVDGHSMLILTSAAVVGAMGVLGNVVGWAWAEHKFGVQTLPALGGGMALSGLLPSIISWIMHPEHHALFSVETFFFIASGFTVLGGISFTLLEFHPRLQRGPGEGATYKPPGVNNGRVVNSLLEDQKTPLLLEPHEDAAVGITSPTRRKKAIRSFILRMITLAFIASIIFGWQPSLLPYLIPNHSLVGFQVAGQVSLAEEEDEMSRTLFLFISCLLRLIFFTGGRCAGPHECRCFHFQQWRGTILYLLLAH